MANRFSVILVKGLLRWFSIQPLWLHRLKVRPLAFLIEKVFRYRNNVVKSNLRNSFPDKTEDELKRIRREFYRHFATIIVETVWFGGSSPERLRKSHIVEVANAALMNGVYENSPAVMVMYSHAGNWELLGGMESFNYAEGVQFCATSENCCAIYLQQHSAVADAVIRDNRLAPIPESNWKDCYIESRQLVRYALKHKGIKKIYNVNTDQRPYFKASDAVSVTFMHQPCRTMSAAAALAHKLGMAVLFQRMPVREDGKGYTVEYVKICDNGAEMSVEDMMKRYYELLEADINAQPFNYLWTHKRWA